MIAMASVSSSPKSKKRSTPVTWGDSEDDEYTVYSRDEHTKKKKKKSGEPTLLIDYEIPEAESRNLPPVDVYSTYDYSSIFPVEEEGKEKEKAESISTDVSEEDDEEEEKVETISAEDDDEEEVSEPDYYASSTKPPDAESSKVGVASFLSDTTRQPKPLFISLPGVQQISPVIPPQQQPSPKQQLSPVISQQPSPEQQLSPPPVIPPQQPSPEQQPAIEESLTTDKPPEEPAKVDTSPKSSDTEAKQVSSEAKQEEAKTIVSVDTAKKIMISDDEELASPPRGKRKIKGKGKER